MALTVKYSAVHGRGCFANRMINKGEMFTFPIIRIKPSDSEYLFPWEGKKYKSIVIGEPNFCNSSNEPNFKIHSIDKDKLTKTFISLKNINEGEEIFLNYGI